MFTQSLTLDGFTGTRFYFWNGRNVTFASFSAFKTDSQSTGSELSV